MYQEYVISSLVKATVLIIIFHGYGDKNTSFIDIAHEFSKILPSAEIRIPNGFDKLDNIFCGYQWFDILNDSPSSWKNDMVKSSKRVDQYIQWIFSQHKEKFKKIILVGFSQGAMLALHVGLKNNFDGIIAFSGALLDTEVASTGLKTKILLSHGTKDSVVPVSCAYSAIDTIKKNNIYIETSIVENVQHSISQTAFQDACKFLKSHFSD